MNLDPIKLQLSSAEAQADLAKLDKSFTAAGAASAKMAQTLGTAVGSMESSFQRASRSMEKYAQVVALLGKIRTAGNPAVGITELAKAMDQLGRAKLVSEAQVKNLQTLSTVMRTFSAGSVAGLSNAVRALSGLGAIKVPTAGQIRNLEQFFITLKTFSSIPSTRGLGPLMTALGSIKAPSSTAIKNIKEMFNVFSTAKPLAGATTFARDLDLIAAAAGRAGAALATLPNYLRTYSSAQNAANRATRGAHTGVRALGGGLGILGHQFNLAYQAGTVFSTVFSVFTLGAWIRSVYEANIQLLKLQKAVLFATGSFEEGSKATEQYLGIEQRLGLSISDNIEYYGRFLIAARASNMSVKEANEVYSDVETALTVVGASSQQASLALYGLTEMMQKGVVYSKEFNRQIGAQLPGNAVIGARALSDLKGQAVSVSEFFKEMHSGTLMSATFIPVWAAEVKKMYGALLPLAQARPDSIIQRLKNAFFEFNRTVGQGSFMSAIAVEVKAFTDKIVTVGEDNIPHLTGSAQKLADTLGQNLASGVEKIGNLLIWLMDHIDGVIKTIKFFVAYDLAKTFLNWGVGAFNAARGVWALVTAMKALQSGTLIGATITAVSAVAALAYTSRGNKTGDITSKGNAMTYGNVQDGAFSVIMDKFKEAAYGLADSLKLVSDSFRMLTGDSLTSAKTIAFVAAAITDFFSTLIAPFKLLFDMISMDVSTVMLSLSHWGRVIGDVMRGDFVQAGKDYNSSKDRDMQHAILAKGKEAVGGDLSQIFDGNFDSTYNSIMKRSNEIADSSAQSILADAANKDVQAALQQLHAAQANQEAASLFSDTVDQFKEGMKPLDFFKDVVTPIQSLISGEYAKKNTPHPRLQGLGGEDSNKQPSLAQLRALGVDSKNVAPGTGLDLFGLAKGYLGTNEHNDSDLLKSMFQGAGITLDPEKTAWCAAFVNAILAQKGVVGTKSAAASSFMDYGDKVTKPSQGDIVVMKDHVGFYAGTNPNGSIQVIGGNQGDSVSRANFKASDVLGYRRPNTIGVSAKYAQQYLEGSSLETPLPGEGAPETPADKLSAMMMKDYKKIEQQSAAGGPIAAAASRLQESMASTAQVIATDQGRVKSGLPTIFNKELLAGLVRAWAELKDTLTDAIDPISKMMGDEDDQNKITQMRIAGLSEEADYQEEVNKLLKEKYNATEIANMADKEALANQNALNRSISSSVELLNAQTAAKLASQTRNSGDPIANFVNEQVAKLAQEKGITPEAALSLAKIRPFQTTVDENGVETAQHLDSPMENWLKTAGVNARTSGLNNIAGMAARNRTASELIGRNPVQQQDYQNLREAMAAVVPDVGKPLKDMFQDVLALAEKTQTPFDKMVLDTAQMMHNLQNESGVQKWMDSVETFGQAMNAIEEDFLTGLSDGLTELFTGGHFDIGVLLEKELKSAIGNQVSNGLKTVLSDLGLNDLVGIKRDGSSPLSALYVNDISQNPSGLPGAGGLADLLRGSGGNTFGDGSGGLGSLIGSAARGIFGSGAESLFGNALGIGGLFGSTAASVVAPTIAAPMFDLASMLPSLGFATGGSFQVGGSGGTDSQSVKFKATPGEYVNVSHGEPGGDSGVTVQIIDQRSGSGSAPVTTSSQKGPDGRQILTVMVRDAMKANFSDGSMDQHLQANYGVSRQATPRATK